MAAYGIGEGDIIAFTVHQRLFGQTVLNRMHYRYSGPTVINGPAELQQFLNNITTGSHWPTQLRQRQSKDLSVERMSAQKVSTQRWAAEWLVQASIGGNAGNALPSNVDIVFQKHVPQANRRGLQGRMHVTGIPTDNIVGDQLTGAAFLVWNAVSLTMSNLIVTGAGSTYTPVIWSRASGVTTYHEISLFTVSLDARIMRRRTVGVGI